VQVRFACASKVAPMVELAASFETKVPIPKGCPDAGKSLALRLACDATTCLGVAHLPKAAEVKLEGPRERVVATGLPAGASITLAGLQLEALRTRRQQLNASYLSLERLSVGFSTPERGSWFYVRADETFWVSDAEDDPNALQLVVHRRSRKLASIEGWLRSGAKVLDLNVPVGESVKVPCRTLSQSCKTDVELEVDAQR
jgi:hypothetical protein